MKKQFITETSRMQKLAGILTESQINENESPQLTDQERSYLDDEIEKFLNNSLFNSEILASDSEDFNPTREERAIQFIIDALQERISYY